MCKPTCIPGHLFPAPRNRHFEKRLPKEKRPTRVGDQPMRRTMPVMNVSIDKAGSDELVPGINLTVDCSVKTWPDKDDLVVFVDDHPVANQSMTSICMTNDPASVYGSSHGNNSPQPPILQRRSTKSNGARPA